MMTARTRLLSLAVNAMAALTLCLGHVESKAANKTLTIIAQPPFAKSEKIEHKFHIVCANCAPFVHAASLVHVDGQLAAFWYQGQFEGAPNTSIQTARFNGTSWSDPTTVTDQISTARELGRFVKTLGNPVPYLSSDGVLTLFYVAVSGRGWATAGIVAKQSYDGGHTWTSSKRIVTSPLFNLSTMIKTQPLDGENGRILLPAYWCFGTTYPILIELSPDLQVRRLIRIAPRGNGLQPSIGETRKVHLVAFLRTLTRDIHRHGLLAVYSKDAGMNWSEPRDIGFENPGAPVAVVKMDESNYALVFNDKSEESLYVSIASGDLMTWQNKFSLVGDGEQASDVKAYPFAVTDNRGTIDVVYTCAGYHSICHTRFSSSWANGRANAGASAQ